MTTTPLELVLTKKQLEVFSIVRDAGIMGITIDRLESKLYDHELDPPLTARNCTYVHINLANKKLALFDLKIIAVSRRYIVVRLKDAPRPRTRVLRYRRDRHMWAI